MNLRTGSVLACFSLLLILQTCTQSARAEKLEITSRPPGATVEIDGVPVGVTPLEIDVPGGYFHRTKTAIGKRLEHPLTARVTLSGYATKELPLSEGPMQWIGLNGRHHGDYWLLKTNHFHVELDSIPEVFTGTIFARAPKPQRNETDLAPTNDPVIFPIEDIIAKARPAVVYLKGSS